MFQRTVPICLATVVLTLAAACGTGSTDSTRLTGPGPNSQQSATMPGGMPGGMGGGGMGGGMMVTNEFDYLTQMIPHHDEAIVTAGILQRGTQRAEMRRFAAAIIDTQSAEVQQMKAWLAAWYPGRDTSVAYEPMMRDLTALSGDALDKAFLQDMVPHHMMAVMMSQQLVMRGGATHPEVIPFANTIASTQRAEIHMMNTWLREWFGGR